MKAIKKILIIRLSSIGDIVLTSPILRILRNFLPDSRIDFLIRREYTELIKFNPNINNVIEFDTSQGLKGLYFIANEIKNNQYDLILDLHNNLRSNYIKFFSKAKFYTINKRTIKRFLLVKFKINLYRDTIFAVDKYLETIKFLKLKNDNKGLDLFYTDDIKLKSEEIIKHLPVQDYDFLIGVAPSAKHYTKIWPAEKYIELLTMIIQHFNAFVFLFGSQNEAEYINQINNAVKTKVNKNSIVNMAGKLSLLETAALMDKCKVIITNDTGLMHIAAARKRKIVAIFGSTVKEFGFFPYGTESIVVENNNINCRPCTHIGRDSCPKLHLKCLNDITVDMVYNAYKNILNVK